LAAIIGPFLLFETQISEWLSVVFSAVRDHPWMGASVIVALLAGDAVLPVPSSLVSAFAGAVFNWELGTAIIWCGMCLGCVFAYGLGSSAGRVLAFPIVGEAELARARRLFTDIGPAALIVTRAVPVLAEAGAMAAGAARMPFWPFMISTSVANAGIAVAYAATGAAAAASGSFLIVFTGLATVPAIGWAFWRLIAKRRDPTV
jgi:uncharacterized membrane protein YdjX (TVP38/TMEM64 family)